ncbi:MAG: hypothetical protein ABSC08_12870 [Bryobacteraceae bacterium]
MRTAVTVSAIAVRSGGSDELQDQQLSRKLDTTRKQIDNYLITALAAMEDGQIGPCSYGELWSADENRRVRQ